MDERKVQEAIEFLDRTVPRDGAFVTLHQYGGGPDEGQVIANAAGFLRFGIEVLKGAFAPIDDKGETHAVPVDIAYLVTNDSSIKFDWFERRDRSDPKPPEVGTRIFSVLVVFALSAGVVLALIGLVTVVRWLAA